MKEYNLRKQHRYIFLPLFSLILAALMLFAVGCNTPEQSDVPETEPAVPDVQLSAEKVETDPDPMPPTEADIDIADFAGLVISKVYGNGGSRTAACEHSFIELTNTGSSPLELRGLALYYKAGKKSDYTSFPLPDLTLESGETCLIRGWSSQQSSAEYDRSGEVIRIEDYDAEWKISLNSRDIRLLLAPAGRTFEKSVPPEEAPGVISCFAAADGYTLDTGTVSDFTVETMAVRTAMKQDSGYYLKDLTKATTESLEQIAPVTSEGKRAVIVGSRLSEVRFSKPAGFYAERFRLELTAPVGYPTIYYTTDGSDPKSSDTRQQYKDAIPLDDTTEKKFGATYKTGLKIVGQIATHARKMIGAHVIKACGYNGKSYTGAYTNSYFISPKMEGYGVSVMSISLETKQMFGNPGFYHNFNPSSNDPNTRGKAFLEVFDKDGIRRGYSNVELAASGHGSSGTGMRSMKVFIKASANGKDGTDPSLHFDLFGGYARNAKGQAITDFSRLVLRNSGNDCGASYIRDAFMQRVSRTMEADTMAYAPVLVFVNGDFWGIYNARERYSGEYVESHYGVDKDNVALIESDYSQVHTNQNAPFVVNSGLPDDADDFNDLVKFIRRNKMDVEENYEYVQSKLDLDSLIDLFVSRLYFNSLDFPGNNIKLWRNRASDDPSGADNRWHFVMLDMDMGISFYKGANDTTEVSSYFSWLKSDSTVASSIIHRLLSNKSFKNRFMTRFYGVLNEIYDPTRLEEELGRIVAERAPIEDLQSERWGASMTKYEGAISDMRQFVRRRNPYALKYLCKFFGVTEEDLIALTGLSPD